MKRPSTAGLAAGILIIVASGALSGAGEPARSLAAQSGAAASTRQASSHQRSAAPIPVKQAGDAGDVATGFMIAGPGGMYTVTAINGQTITATARGIGFAVSVSGDGAASGQVVVGGPGGDGGPVPAPPGPGIVNTMPLTVTITVSDSTVYTRAKHAASLSDVQVGSVLHVEGKHTGTTISAATVEIVLPQRTGVVTAVNGGSLTITSFDARTYTIATSGDTVYDRAGQTAALTDVSVGSLILAEGTPDGSTLNALAVSIQVPSVAGQVTAVSGNTVTVQGPDGTTSTVLLTGATTYSAGPGGTASRSSMSTGSLIMAQGTVGSDGSLTALRVTIATAIGAGQSTSASGTTTSGSISF